MLLEISKIYKKWQEIYFVALRSFLTLPLFASRASPIIPLYIIHTFWEFWMSEKRQK